MSETAQPSEPKDDTPAPAGEEAPPTPWPEPSQGEPIAWPRDMNSPAPSTPDRGTDPKAPHDA
jgi:hypothetical protein